MQLQRTLGDDFSRWCKEALPGIDVCGRWEADKLMYWCAVPLRSIPDGKQLSDAARKAKRDHPNDSALFLDGTHYIGSLNADGQPHGQGASFHADGSPEVALLTDSDASKNGRWVDGKVHGRARFLFANGNRYEGMFQDSTFNGLGMFVWKDGSRYEGEWVAHEHCGLGVKSDQDGHLVECGRWEAHKLVISRAVPLRYLPEGKHLTDAAMKAKHDHPNSSALMSDGSYYIGEINADGQPHGQGASYWSDGSARFSLLVDPADATNSGRWDAGQVNGRATHVLKIGERYDGMFKDGLRDGLGVLSWKEGPRYEGEWAANNRNGLGAQWDAAGKLNGCGRWKDYKLVQWCAVPLRCLPEGKHLSAAALKVQRAHPTGSFAQVDNDGRFFIGDVNLDGQPHGQGSRFHPDGSPYVTLLIDAADASKNGRWENGKLQGRAIVLADGNRYEGMFKDDKFNGLGVFGWKPGQRYEGEWAAGKFSELGAMWDKDGKFAGCGRWKDGQLVEPCAVPLRCLPEGKLLSAAARKAKAEQPNDSALMPTGSYYIGQLNTSGQPNGQGAVFHPDGTACVTLLVDAADASKNGRWAEGKLNGKATRQYLHGDRYEGMFKDDKFNGLGVSCRKDGRQYEGEFVAGKRSGLGAMWDKDGKLIKCGRWKNDELVEPCPVPVHLLPEKRCLSEQARTASLLFPDGSYFVGPINAQDHRHGKGRMFSKSGSLLQAGMWLADQLQPSRKALLIGNDIYAPPTSNLHCCVNDATDMQTALVVLGFHCTLTRNATRSEMMTALAVFIESLQPDDVAFIYFSGHGAESDGKTYLVPSDWTAGSTYRNAVDLNVDILHDLNSKNCNLLNIIVLDCCRVDTNNATFRCKGIGSPSALSSRSPASMYERLPTNGRFLIAYSSDPGTVSQESCTERNGWFTSCLLPCLAQPDLRLMQIFGEAEIALERKTNGRQRSWVNATPSLFADQYNIKLFKTPTAVADDVQMRSESPAKAGHSKQSEIPPADAVASDAQSSPRGE